MSTNRSLSIIIPIYNEASTIEQVVRRVWQVDVGLSKELVIVDDHSTDGTREILEGLERESRAGERGGRLKVIFHERNAGKGSAIRTGLQHVTGDYIVIQDADLEYDPRDYPKLLQPILEGRADVVFGNRFHGGPHRVLYFWHYCGNRFLTRDSTSAEVSRKVGQPHPVWLHRARIRVARGAGVSETSRACA